MPNIKIVIFLIVMIFIAVLVPVLILIFRPTDKTPPTIQILTPTNTKYMDHQIDINFTTSDSDVDTIWYRIYDDTAGTWYDLTNITWTSLTQRTLTFDKSYTLYVWANDTAGNIANAVTVSFTISAYGEVVTGISVAPGAPSDVDPDHILRVGILDPMTEIQGEGAWEGAFFACDEINKAGGVTVGGETYYFEIIAEDTFENELPYNDSKAQAAVIKLIDVDNAQYIIGGFRHEAVESYIENIMDEKMLFFSTGAANDTFARNLNGTGYERYKYWFRIMPLNSTSLATEILWYLAYLRAYLEAALGKPINRLGIIREDLNWTIAMTNALKIYAPLYGWTISAEIAYPLNATATNFSTYLTQINANDTQVLFPLISGEGGMLMMSQYAAIQPGFLIAGIDVHSQLDTYWDDTGGACQYEVIMQSLYRVNKSTKSIPFWDNFVSNFGHEPLYTAIGSYDAMYLLKDAITITQSLNSTELIPALESYTKTNTYEGVAGNIGFTAWHDLEAGYNVTSGKVYSTGLFCQWQAGGTKAVVSSGGTGYPEYLVTAPLALPPWTINTYGEVVTGVLETPGAPSDVDPDHILRVGILDPMKEIQGEGAWRGAFFACDEINKAGGVTVGGETYYFGIIAEDTFENELPFNESKAQAAVIKLLNVDKAQYIIGGFRKEAVESYIENIMDEKMLFFSTGAANDTFAKNLNGTGYERYKYWFRIMPLNSTSLAIEIIQYLAYLRAHLEAALGKPINRLGIIREDLNWTVEMTNALKIYAPLYGWTISAEIAYPLNATATNFSTYLTQINTNDTQVLFPLISGEGGMLMMSQYAAIQPGFLIAGIDVHSQLDTYWDDTGGACQYEVIMQSLYRVNKSTKSIPFWDNFVSNFGHEPLYTAIGSYDAMYLLKDAITITQSLNSTELIPALESYTKTNTYEGVAGNIGFTAWHDLEAGYNVTSGKVYSTGLFCQWQAGGTKAVVSSGGTGYPEYLVTAPLALPPWTINTYGEVVTGVLETPGAPSDVDPDHILRVGILDPMKEIQGEGAWRGAFFACDEINKAGGVTVGGETYYFGIIAEDTFENELPFNESKAQAAVIKLLNVDKAQYIIGGFRQEAVKSYMENIMNNKTLFLGTGVTSSEFCENLNTTGYEKYKYWFRVMPLNATSIAIEIIQYLAYLRGYMKLVLGKNVSNLGIIREDLNWTVGLANAIKTYAPLYGWNISAEIAFPLNTTAANFSTYLTQINANDTQVLFPIISGQGGKLIMSQYNVTQPGFLIAGIDVHSQFDTYWANTSGTCQYEVILQSVYRVNKTTKTIAFWDNFVGNFSHEPFYTAIGSYDAMYLLREAIDTAQSLNSTDLIPALETYTKANTYEGVAGNLGFTAWHDLEAGYNIISGKIYSVGLFCQWQASGTKAVVSSGGTGYPEYLVTATLAFPPWGINDES
ncbi:MAG: ABC transporter substrate-binding protein [Promethearchaeota archaeon]